MAITRATRKFLGDVCVDGDLEVTGGLTVGAIDSDSAVDGAMGFQIAGREVLNCNKNLDIDTGTETVDSFDDQTFNVAVGPVGWGAVEWKYVCRKGTDMRMGTVYAVWDTADNVDFYDRIDATLGTCTETDLTFTVDINAGNVRLLATVAADNWQVNVTRIGR